MRNLHGHIFDLRLWADCVSFQKVAHRQHRLCIGGKAWFWCHIRLLKLQLDPAVLTWCLACRCLQRLSRC